MFSSYPSHLTPFVPSSAGNLQANISLNVAYYKLCQLSESVATSVAISLSNSAGSEPACPTRSRVHTEHGAAFSKGFVFFIGTWTLYSHLT